MKRLDVHRTAFGLASALGLASLAAALTAGCAPGPANSAKQTEEEAAMVRSEPMTKAEPPSKALPAPAIPGAVIRIRAADAGKTIAAPVGQVFQVELVGVPTAGYLWAVKSAPAFLEKTAETGGDTTTDQRKPGFAGGSHWEVFAFKATTAGTGALVLEQRRPWETNEPPANSFTVTIAAQ